MAAKGKAFYATVQEKDAFTVVKGNEACASHNDEGANLEWAADILFNNNELVHAILPACLDHKSELDVQKVRI